MEKGPLFFKEKISQRNNVEIIFHKEFTYIYNPENSPVVKYSLVNCSDLFDKKFEILNLNIDGLFVNIIEKDNSFTFEVADLWEKILEVTCEKISEEEVEYRKNDYIDLINEIIRQRDSESEVVDKLSKQIEVLKTFTTRELIVNERKRSEANWLSNDKQKFIEGYLSGLEKVANLLADRTNGLD